MDYTIKHNQSEFIALIMDGSKNRDIRMCQVVEGNLKTQRNTMKCFIN